MGKVKAWAMDHEDHVVDAIEHAGATSVNDVVAYLKTHMQFVDERYVKELCAQFWNVEGYPKEMTEEQIRELDNIALSEGWV